jgi:hypothetical protein
MKSETLNFVFNPKVKDEDYKDQKLYYDLNKEIINNV